MKKLKPLFFVLLMAVLANAGNHLSAQWDSLFDGKTLKGWVQKNGKAKLKVKDEAIFGTTVPSEPNSFLCTERHYANFVLEVKFWMDEELNSGVQIRSQSSAEYVNGRVHGYQVEIDPSPRAWTGGIYD